MEDWAALPTELLMVIAQQLYSTKEFVCFGVVCKTWLLATSTLKKDKNLVLPKFPCLMVAEEELDEKDAASQDASAFPGRGFFNLQNEKICVLEVPYISMGVCLGVSYGWLFTIGYDFQVSLVHPFSRDQISLPPFSSASYQYEYVDEYDDESDDILTPPKVIDMFIKKVALSAHPKERDCVVMAIYGVSDIIAFARPGDEQWTTVSVPSKYYEDVVFYRGQFYVVDCDGMAVVCDIDGDDGPKSKVIAPPPVGRKDIKKYLVESSGDLLLITKVIGGFVFVDDEDSFRYYPRNFSIMKMEESFGKDKYPYCWVPMVSIGDMALFLGRNTSVSLSASAYNGYFEANCIYFTADNLGQYGEYSVEELGSDDMGIFDIENGTIKPHYNKVSSLSYRSPPVWII